MGKLIMNLAFAAAFLALLAVTAQTETPSLTSYQGILLDGAGDPVTSPVSVDFTIWDSENGGFSVWSENQTVSPDTEGRFSVLLGQVNPLADDVFSQPDRWLGMSVDGGPELAPRTRITSTAYAQRAGTVDGASGGNIVTPVRVTSQSGDIRLALREGPSSSAGIGQFYDAAGYLNILLGVTTGNPDHGAVGIYDELGNERATMWIPSDGSGMVSTNGPNESGNTRLSYLSGYPNNGYISVRDEFNTNKARMFVNSVGSGTVSINGQTGYIASAMGNLSGYPDNGIVLVDDAVNPGGFVRAAMYATGQEAGIVYTSGANRASENAALSFLSGYPDNGYVGVLDADRNWQAGMYVDDTGQGEVYTQGANGGCNAYLTALNGYPDNGYVGVSGALSCYTQAGVYVDPDETGIIYTRGPNHNRNVRLGNTSGLPDNGSVSVWDGNDVEQAGMYVDSNGDGVIYADIKNFRVANPVDDNTEIWYASLEGPEAAAYIRGTGHLVNGQAVVELEDHFVSIANMQSATVQVTPLSAESKGLAVVEKNADRLVVAELFNGTGTYDFDFTVTAVRAGHEDYQVIRPTPTSRPALDEPSPIQIGVPVQPVPDRTLFDGSGEEAESRSSSAVEIEQIDNNSRPR